MCFVCVTANMAKKLKKKLKKKVERKAWLHLVFIFSMLNIKQDFKMKLNLKCHTVIICQLFIQGLSHF